MKVSFLFLCAYIFKSEANEEIITVERGSAYTKEYGVYFKKGNKIISPWHDVPLYNNENKKHFNMICEIPRWTNAKMEISTKEKLNPIKQDVKNNELRFVKNPWPYHGYIWNYGALPQTWENSSYIDPRTNAKGDNDPIDIIDIGYRVAKRGEFYPVKILGVLALIDENETDWKLLAIDVNDPLANNLTDINDIDTYMPGFLSATREWFRIYKIPNGKPANKFGFNGEFQNREFAHGVIEETHEFWKNLVKNSTMGELDTHSVEYTEAGIRISGEEAEEEVNSQPAYKPPTDIDPKVDMWYFVKEPSEGKEVIIDGVRHVRFKV